MDDKGIIMKEDSMRKHGPFTFWTLLFDYFPPFYEPSGSLGNIIISEMIGYSSESLAARSLKITPGNDVSCDVNQVPSLCSSCVTLQPVVWHLPPSLQLGSQQLYTGARSFRNSQKQLSSPIQPSKQVFVSFRVKELITLFSLGTEAREKQSIHDSLDNGINFIKVK